jgi:site-specific recombinase XerD
MSVERTKEQGLAPIEEMSIVPRRWLRNKKTRSGREFLEEFLDYAKRERSLCAETIRCYRSLTGSFLDFIGDLDVGHVRPRDIRAYLAWLLGRGASSQTLRRNLCALRSFYRYLELCDVVAVSPARVVQNRKVTRPLPKPLSEDDVNKLIASATSLHQKALVEFLYSTGCRVAEVAGARVENVDWSGRTVKILGKGSRERLVPMGSRAVKTLRDYLDGRRKGFLFQEEGKPDQLGHVIPLKGKWLGIWRENYAFDSSGRLTFKPRNRRLGKMSQLTREEARAALARIVQSLPRRPRPAKDVPISPRTIYAILKRLALRAGVADVHPHRLRHSFATHMHERGADILTISRLLGHSSVTTTQIYTHVSQRSARETLERCHPHWSPE